MNRDLLVRRELRAMHKTAYRVRHLLIQVLHEEDSRIESLRLKPADVLRLGILQAWATRHSVPLRYVLQTLLTYWRKKTRRPGKKSLLGVTVAVLTSVGSEGVLMGAIEKDFPGDEHIAQRQTAERLCLLGLDELRGKAKSLLDADSPEQSCIMYLKRVERRQKRLDKALAAQWRRRRRWRGNPWL